MAITNEFREAVQSGDIYGLRIMMKDSLLIDTSFEEFYEMEALARDVAGLYDEHDGRELNHNSTEWTEDYLALLMVQVVSNFSHERLEHLKKVVRHLYPLNQRTAEQPPRNTHTAQSGPEEDDYLTQKARDMANGSYRGSTVAVSAVIAGGVGAVIAGVAGGSAATAAAVGLGCAAAGGAIAYAVMNENKK